MTKEAVVCNPRSWETSRQASLPGFNHLILCSEACHVRTSFCRHSRANPDPIWHILPYSSSCHRPQFKPTTTELNPRWPQTARGVARPDGNSSLVFLGHGRNAWRFRVTGGNMWTINSVRRFFDMDEGSSPITELSNYITRQIDVGTSAEIVRLLRQCDAQLFAGWEKWPSIYDKQTGEAMAKVSRAVHDVLRNTNGAVVISGCGTSGRLAFLLSQHFNELAREQGLKPNYNYIIAGGDTALLTSQEAPEDSWEEGQEKLREMSEGCEKVVFIGVSCGLSAPFVAGQLDYCMDHPERFIPVLVGFNPVHLARDTPIKNSDKTFRDVATRLSGKSLMSVPHYRTKKTDGVQSRGGGGGGWREGGEGGGGGGGS